MKNGDPKKPKENNGKLNSENIPELTVELVSVKEIIKNNRLLGKEIVTKSTIKFKNPGQIEPGKTEWDKIAFSRDWIQEDSPETFEELCKKAKGTIDETGDVCDIENTVIGTLNKFILNDANGKKIKDNKGKEGKEADELKNFIKQVAQDKLDTPPLFLAPQIGDAVREQYPDCTNEQIKSILEEL